MLVYLKAYTPTGGKNYLEGMSRTWIAFLWHAAFGSQSLLVFAEFGEVTVSHEPSWNIKELHQNKFQFLCVVLQQLFAVLGVLTFRCFYLFL